jgi:TRAP-type mannitol/chloroaromatic compound transport system substrate-binding protein
VLSVDSQSVTTLEGLKWRPFSGVGQAVFSLLGVKPEEKK